MYIFLSDAHIRKDSSHRARRLIAFLRKMRNKITHLFILGDLFEIWFEYNIVFPKDYFKTLSMLHSLIQDGIEVHYILGNHEIMIGPLFHNFGFIIHKESASIDINGKRVYIAHGHKIDRRLWTTFWEFLLTSKFNHALYQLIHPDLGVFLAQGIAYLSRKQRPNPHASRLFENFARQQLSNYDIVVLAHLHMPVLRKFGDQKYYINTGDWVDNFSYGVINKNNVELCYFK